MEEQFRTLDIEAKDIETRPEPMPKFKVPRRKVSIFEFDGSEQELDAYVKRLETKTKCDWFVVARWYSRTVLADDKDFTRFMSSLPFSAQQDFGREWERAKLHNADTGETKNIYRDATGRWRKA